MDRSAEIKRLAVDWGQKRGRNYAIPAMIKIGFSVSMTEKILGGRYFFELRPQRADRLAKLLRKDGFCVTGKKAS